MPKTLALCEKISREWGVQLLIIKMARRIKQDAGATTKIQEASAVRNWIHNNVKYVSDPHGAELVGTPVWVLKNGGDCDDMVALAGALLQAIGHKTSPASVRWKGRQWPTHAVLVDWTAAAIVDAVPDLDLELWPPENYEAEEIIYRTPEGEQKSLDGIFAKFHNWYSKQWTKVFKPHTFLGKLSDPLGLSSRNIKAGRKAADVVGTAAAIVGAAYGLGAVMVGTGGGFWGTVGSGFGAMGQGAKWVGGKLFGTGAASGAGGAGAAGGGGWLATAAKTVATVSAIEAATGKKVAPEAAPMTPGAIEYAGGGGYGGGGSYGGGGGGSYGGAAAAPEPVMAALNQDFMGIPTWGWLVGGGVVLVALSSGGKK